MKLKLLLLATFLINHLIFADGLDEANAKSIVQKFKRSKGLVLVVGQSNDAITLAKNSEFYIHTLTDNSSNIQAERKLIEQAKLANQISIITNEEKSSLPYADNLINLIIVAKAEGGSLDAKEVKRACAPQGIIFVEGSNQKLINDLASLKLEAQSLGTWKFFEKPVPAGFDSWSHIKGSSGQSYSNNDTEVGPWKEIRWIADPKWGSLASSYTGFVSAGGRLYYKESITTDKGANWFLICRDAYNGVELWRQNIGGIMKYIRVPDFTVCCDENNIYYRSELTMISRDGNTGKILNKFETKSPNDFAIVCGDILLACNDSILTAFDKNYAKTLWTEKITGKPAAEGKTVYIYSTDKVKSLNINTGKLNWEANVGPLVGKEEAQLIVKKGVVFFTKVPKYTGDSTIYAFDANTGKPKWDQKGNWGYGLIPYDNEIWMIGINNKMKTESVNIKAVNNSDGKPTQDYRIPGSVMGKCFSAKSTTNYLLYSNGWYYDIQKKQGFENNTTRSPCFIGQHPANGLTYYLPHHCDCQVTLRGFLALSKNGQKEWQEKIDENITFKKGLGKVPSAKDAPNDWPIYRKDGLRTNSSSEKISGNIKLNWSTSFGTSPLSQATISYGTAYITDEMGEKVIAVDPVSGKEKWIFYTMGSPKSSASLKDGYCLIGTGAGYVHCLNAITGEEIWTRRVAPAQIFIGDRSKFDSPWSVAGSILIKDDVAYLSVGRSTTQTLGMFYYAINIKTGAVFWRNSVKGGSMSGDMFLTDGKDLMYVNKRYDFAKGLFNMQNRNKLPISGLRTTVYLTGVSIVDYMNSIEPRQTDKRHVYLSDGVQEGDVFSSTVDNSVTAGRISTGYGGDEWKTKYGQFFLKTKGVFNWNLDDLKFQIYGMVTTEDRIFTVGISADLDPSKKAEIRVYALKDGALLQTLPIEGQPIYDALSLSNGILYLATKQGTLSAYSIK